MKTGTGPKAVMAGNYGFTLLELLISLVLSMLVLIIVGGAVKLGFSSVRDGWRNAGRQERFESVCNILDSQVQDMVVLAPAKHHDYSFGGDSGSMRFASVYSIWGGRRGCVWVQYKVKPAPDGKQQLFAEETVTGTDMAKKTMLLPSADNISFKYFGGPKGKEGKWTDDPGAEVRYVGIDFEYGTRRVHMVIPVNVRDSLNNP
ncbi:MAG: prepilin-type N-terminal cleavage/methylation domain-containing protein [Nitrospiraceae bacterium]|nr:prepilin-type N-terminal cleavage/methylation domain-containing protein [Nitrospiraceae bacterium]